MMTEATFNERVNAVNWMLSFAGNPVEVVRGKRVVEIGSGFGAGAIATLKNGAAHYVGIDPEPFGARVIELEGYDPGYRVAYERAAVSIDKRQAIFVEGFADDWPGEGTFDLCLIADVMEHVADPGLVARSALRLLKPGGKVVASTAPLFFSPDGHHLFDVLSDRPWNHLFADFDRSAVAGLTSDYLMGEFDNLNGVTHEGIVNAFIDSGFKIEQQRALIQQRRDFRAIRHLINPEYLEKHSDDIFQQEVSQIVAVKS